MKSLALFVTLAISTLAISTLAAADDSTSTESALAHFESKVRPVLIAECFPCHASHADAKPAGEVRLDSRERLIRDRFVVPGKLRESRLLAVSSQPHPRVEGEPRALEPRHLGALRAWIRSGAPWTPPIDPSVETKARLWSLAPVSSPEIPIVDDESWNASAIDAFVRARQVSAGISPVREASRRTLIRRATLHVTGLPPTPDEVTAFLDDESTDAWELVVDRLLASKAYGERQGRHWLDLVRYADTAGDAADFPVPEAFRYRNWVLDAFHEDQPYDDFVREQIAGDLLPSSDEETRWKRLLATGYIAISRRIGVSPLGLRHITIESTIDNFGKIFLGLSVGCARCHDHKFDPIPTEDYYALYGIFDSSIYPHAGQEHNPHRRDFVYRVGEKRSDEILRPFRAKLDPWLKKERRALAVYRSFQSQKITNPNLTRESTWNELQRVRADLTEVAETFPDLEIAYAVRDGEPKDAHVQRGGEPRSRGARVTRGFLSALGGHKVPSNAEGSGRLELARWVTAADNPLFARVIVNRVWHHLFGRGLVRSTSDFGTRGAPPTHPELLDHLAARFHERGASIKDLYREILLSETYRRSAATDRTNAARDPLNGLLWRANRRRLDAEQIRDGLLSLSGELDRSTGGRHPFPHHLTYFYRQHEPFSETYETKRRSVYELQRRLEKNPFLELFDGPDGNLHLGERGASTTTLQSLYLLNSEFVHAQAASFARRLLRETKGDSTRSRVRQAYERVFARLPTGAELETSTEILAKLRRELSRNASKDTEHLAWSSYLRSMMTSNEFLFVD